MNQVSCLVIGAGPTGLGAAWRLAEIGQTDWLLVDAGNRPGGLAASIRDEKGFVWDFAVHVAHSHYNYFDRLMESLLPDGFYNHERRAWVRLAESWVPYPFQYNFRHLPPGMRAECLEGLLALNNKKRGVNVEGGRAEQLSFRDWIYMSFGEGIAKHFMLPYNEKIWTVNPAEMSASWLGERVPAVDIARVLRNIEKGLDDVAWGPNHTFQFPKQGGTGAIWEALYSRLPVDCRRLQTQVVHIDSNQRVATFADGERIGYEYLVSTMPLPVLADKLNDSMLMEAVRPLRHSHVQVAGIGVYRSIPDEIADKTWIYCPENTAKFYRVTPFSSFSPDHTPSPGSCCSFLCEFASAGSGPLLKANISELAVEGLRNLGIIDIRPDELHVQEMAAEYGYPVPTLERDNILHKILPELEKIGIYSRGRFGGWKYEVANMDHSLMQGVEAINHIMHGAEQLTIYFPSIVNGEKRSQ